MEPPILLNINASSLFTFIHFASTFYYYVLRVLCNAVKITIPIYRTHSIDAEHKSTPRHLPTSMKSPSYRQVQRNIAALAWPVLEFMDLKSDSACYFLIKVNMGLNRGMIITPVEQIFLRSKRLWVMEARSLRRGLESVLVIVGIHAWSCGG